VKASFVGANTVKRESADESAPATVPPPESGAAAPTRSDERAEATGLRDVDDVHRQEHLADDVHDAVDRGDVGRDDGDAVDARGGSIEAREQREVRRSTADLVGRGRERGQGAGVAVIADEGTAEPTT
jgi:hypothetical protein